MPGVVWTVLFCTLAAMSGMALLSRWTLGLDPAERLGVSGLAGLGATGLLTLLVGLLPSGLGFALPVVLLALVTGSVVWLRSGTARSLAFKLPSGRGVLALLGLVGVGLVALLGVLVPSVSTDWDTIAYHLAVPKLWLAHGQIDAIRGIHHSNFPSTMEVLFHWGLKWGGQSGAKAFSLVVLVFGCLSVFGLARRWYGAAAGWWAALAFAGIPVVAWESGTGYIDVAHGLFVAFAFLYAAEALKSGAIDKSALVLSGVALGFALGTKYTGLQAMLSLAVVIGVAALLRHGFAAATRVKLTVVLVALAIGGPWYVKTAVLTGNPVYPFFSSFLGGKDWDAWRASIYSAEQKSFGVGTNPADFGQAVLGLGYQPGRYTNPRQDTGGGFPTGAIGFAALLGGVCAATCGRLRKEERLVLAMCLLCFFMWFVLSQQSRYLTMLAIPLGVLGAGQVSRVPWGRAVAGAFAVQTVATLYLLWALQSSVQLQVALGTVSQEAYLEGSLPFAKDAKVLNGLPKGSRVALYDEVFGFYLDVPYFWANPGHSMLIPYESMRTAGDFVAGLKAEGFTHVYLNPTSSDRRFLEALLAGKPYSPEERAQMFPDLNLRWRVLLAESVEDGLIAPVLLPGRGLLFTLPKTEP